MAARRSLIITASGVGKHTVLIAYSLIALFPILLIVYLALGIMIPIRVGTVLRVNTWVARLIGQTGTCDRYRMHCAANC